MKLVEICPQQVDEAWYDRFITDRAIIIGLIGLTALTVGAIGWGAYTGSKETAFLERVEDQIAERAKSSFDPGNQFRQDYAEHMRLKKAAEKLVMRMIAQYNPSTKSTQIVPTFVRDSAAVQAYKDHVEYMMDKYQIRVE